VTRPAVAARPVALDEDYHVHSVFSDGASTVGQNVQAARGRGLRTLCLVDHVRRDTGWVADFTRAVRPLRAQAGIRILAGVEAKILDRAGRLDLPGGIDGIDLVLIADHQFPGDGGPVDPQVMRAALEAGEADPRDVISCLVKATANAVRTAAAQSAPGQAGPHAVAPQAAPAHASARPLIAHLFSVLPKMGLAESQVPAWMLGRLAEQARQAGALVEVNEKWGCPSARTVQAFRQAGAEMVASTDSHDCASIGRYARVRQILADAAADASVGGAARADAGGTRAGGTRAGGTQAGGTQAGGTQP
jgi:putative hydrolase